MKVFISADMEGASGVTGINDTEPGQPAYERFKKLLTRDVNAAIEGALKGGARKIFVNDAHYWGRNLMIEELNPKAELISGSNKPLVMMEGIDKTFDAAFFIAYHAKAGTQAAVMNHTMFWNVLNIQVNDESVGEFGLSAMVAGHFGVPAVLVTGDDKMAKEALELLGNIETVTVKKGIDFVTARCLSPEESAAKIKKAAERALMHINEFRPYKIKTPIIFEIEFPWTSMAATAALISGVTRKAPRTISFTAQDAVEGDQMLMATLQLANTANIRALKNIP